MKSLERIFFIFLACVFIVFCFIQGYFFIHPKIQDENRAARLGATLKETPPILTKVNQKEEGLFVYLTFETEKATVSQCSLMVNDKIVGDFSGGILSVKVYPQDKIYLLGGNIGDKIKLMEVPKNLDNSKFPQVFEATGKKIFWGEVQLK
ncbi:MAG: hypothetical protein RSH79_03840 [Clostridiales bacterium]